MRFLEVTLFVLLTSGCSSAPTDAPPGASSPASPEPAADAAASSPRIRFVAEREGAPADVTRIVYTEPFTVKVEGLPPRTAATITCMMQIPRRKGRGSIAKGTFETDAQGALDVSRDPSQEGTYTGVDADGLVWSGAEGPVDDARFGAQSPLVCDVSVGDALVASGALERTFLADGVTVQPVTKEGLVAELFLPALPPGARDLVPVVAFGGSEGGISGGETYAAAAASMGHPALAVAYFGAPGVREELENVPLEYFARAFEWLDRRPETRKGAVVVMGGSRGGELALQLGATFSSVVGVVASTPSSYRWAGLTLDERPAWTFEGKPLPHVPSSTFSARTVPGPGGVPAYVLRDVFESDFAKASPAAREAARIRVEDTHGPVLMIAGSDDQMWPACDYVARAMDLLRSSGHATTHGDEGVCHEGAGHAVGLVGLPTGGSMWASLSATESFALGGTAAANARAGRISQQKMRAFLARVAPPAR